MEEYITNHRDLVKVIDGIPVPDITVSSISQQSARHTPKSIKKQSFTREQIQRIVNQSKQPTTKTKNYTLGTFNCKENSDDRILQELRSAQQGDIIQHNSKMRGQLIEQQNVIESQMSQIAQMNDKIEQLTNQLISLDQSLTQDRQRNHELQSINQQLQFLNDEQKIEIQVLKRLNNQQLVQHKQDTSQYQESLNQMQKKYNEMDNLLSTIQIDKNNTVKIGQLIISEAITEEIPSARVKTVDPELLSEEDTLSMLFSLLSRISKSQRMAKLVKKHADYKKLFEMKRSQPSLAKLPSPQGIDRKLSFNQENFKFLMKNIKKN